MATGLRAAQMLDVVTSVIDAHPLGNNFDYLFSKDCPRHFELLSSLARDKTMIQGGQFVSNFVVYKETGTAAFVLPAQTYQPGITDVIKKVTIPWAHANANWSVIDEELLECRSEQQLLNILGPRRAATQMDLAMLIENEFWAAPDATTYSQGLQPLTMPYWIVPMVNYQVGDTGTVGCDVAGAFQGGITGNDESFTDVAGVDPGTYANTTGFDDNTYARWRNYTWLRTDSAGAWNDTDADRLGWAFEYMDFEVPPLATDIDKPQYRDRKIYVCKVAKQSMERATGNQNSQVGVDLSKYQGRTLFRSLPLTWQIQLDTASASRGAYPIYLTNWAHGRMIVRAGRNFVERSFPGDKYQPDTTTTHTDLSYQIWVPNRQLFGANGSYVAAA